MLYTELLSSKGGRTQHEKSAEAIVVHSDHGQRAKPCVEEGNLHSSSKVYDRKQLWLSPQT